MARFLQFWIKQPTSKAAWVFPVGYMVFLQVLTGIPKPEFWKDLDGLEGFWELSKIIYDYPYYLQDLSHFPLFAGLAWLWSWYLGGPDRGRRFHGTALTIAMAYGILSECLQIILPMRFLSTGDLLMNAAGVVFGAWVHGKVLRRLKQPEKDA